MRSRVSTIDSLKSFLWTSSASNVSKKFNNTNLLTRLFSHSNNDSHTHHITATTPPTTLWYLTLTHTTCYTNVTRQRCMPPCVLKTGVNCGQICQETRCLSRLWFASSEGPPRSARKLRKGSVIMNTQITTCSSQLNTVWQTSSVQCYRFNFSFLET